ncbi:hypothetical protein FGO68_gene2128 [Halteria grandinella]|uniref:Uncharacterized protein n=1 Tax=Halteria grandinella TaxID=5974 RepID=A0A8J8NQL0_HALGN|nr:hypothetical protein FGO68_gene2128 [Halteria grandinella]
MRHSSNACYCTQCGQLVGKEDRYFENLKGCGTCKKQLCANCRIIDKKAVVIDCNICGQSSCCEGSIMIQACQKCYIEKGMKLQKEKEPEQQIIEEVKEEQDQIEEHKEATEQKSVHRARLPKPQVDQKKKQKPQLPISLFESQEIKTTSLFAPPAQTSLGSGNPFASQPQSTQRLFQSTPASNGQAISSLFGEAPSSIQQSPFQQSTGISGLRPQAPLQSSLFGQSSQQTATPFGGGLFPLVTAWGQSDPLQRQHSESKEEQSPESPPIASSSDEDEQATEAQYRKRR